MRRFVRAAVVVLATVGVSASALAQTADFYRSLLKRGVADYGSGKNDAALRELRIAAFGLLDSIPDYETAQVYIALINERLKREPETRAAIQRIFTAEKVSPQYATLPLDDAARAAFETAAKRLLTSTDFARLHGSATIPFAPPEVSGNQQAIVGSDGNPTRPAPVPAPAPAPVPQPVSPPAVQPPRPMPKPPVVIPSPVPQPAPSPVPAPAPAPRTMITPAPNRAQRFADAEAALMRNSLPAARAIYREILAGNDVDHPTAMRIAEGLYRARDFQGAIQAFERAGTLRKGEEPYRYYLAVALYEMGRYEEAKRELAGALPFIEVTPDVERYRAKIEGALQ